MQNAVKSNALDLGHDNEVVMNALIAAFITQFPTAKITADTDFYGLGDSLLLIDIVTDTSNATGLQFDDKQFISAEGPVTPRTLARSFRAP